MIKHIIAQAIRRNGIIDVVILVSRPVIRQLFGAKNKDRAITVLIIFDDRQGSECFTKADAICENAPVKRFQFVDNRQNRILLESIELAPNLAFLEASRFVWQYIFGNIF